MLISHHSQPILSDHPSRNSSINSETRLFFLCFWHMLIKQSKSSMLAEKSRLKKKSKHLKKPLQLKNNINETLAHNARAESILKKEVVKLLPSKPRKNPQERENKLQVLYDKVELKHRSDSKTDSSEEMLVADLERHEQQLDCRDSRKDKRSMLFSHLVKDSNHLSRKLSVLQEKVNQKIKKYSVAQKIKEMSNQASPRPQQNCTLLPKAVQRSMERLNEGNSTELRLANMMITHHNLARIKEQISRPGTLRILDLSYNTLTNKSVGLLADLLSQNTIEQLSLKWNQLTYEGGMELLGAVTCNINLTSLDLSYNKLTNSNQAFQDRLLRLLTDNKYLVHLNLEMCHLSEQQCAAFAKAYNLTNESILCLHFKGNSHYYVNKLGYITKNRTHKDVPEISPPRELAMGRADSMPNLCSKHLIGDECCWLCQHWVGEVFKLPQEIYPSGLIWQEQEIFIHLSCYEYQPIKLSNEECINTMQPRKDCKRLEWSNYQLHLARIPIPANRDVKYFFTSKGKTLINHNQPHIDTNQMVFFEVFDVFSELYADNNELPEKYSVFVRKMNTRSKESFGYNKQKRLKGEACESHFRQAFRKENQKALKSILSKNKKRSIHSPVTFEPLPRISKTKPNSPAHSRTLTAQLPQEAFHLVVNIRKCKEKLPSSVQSEKYISLGMTPRNKCFLFNYKHFAGQDFTLDGDGTRQAELKRVQTQYFGNFKESFITRFLRQRQQQRHVEPFMDRFKILTRRFFNSHQLFFSDIFSFLYSAFISSDTPVSRQQQVKQNGKNKTVKFVAAKETKLSILINSEKQLEAKIGTEAVSLGQQRPVERRALSMNCISDKYQLTKLKAMPAGSIHTLQSNLPSDKTIKSIKELPCDPTSLVQLSLDNLPLPIDLTEDVFAHYSALVTRYAREKRVILQLLSSCQRNCDKERIKELNELIVTYNYYKLTLFYEETVHSGLEGIVTRAGSFTGLANLVANLTPNPLAPLLLQERKSSMLSGSQEGEAVMDLKALQAKITSQSAQDSLLSLGEYLRSEEHPIKILNRSEGMPVMLKSSKKRKGRYGRSLKNIKEELLGEQTKVILPADSDKFLHEIEQEQLNNHYNTLVRQLNLLSDSLLEVLDHLVANYLTSHSCGDERAIVDQWLKSHLTARIATFITEILGEYRQSAQMGRVRERTAQICEYFLLNAVLELGQASVMLSSSVLQQNLKEYQFISPFHSYEFIIGIEITKLTNITHAIQEEPRLLMQHITEVLRKLGESWKNRQLEVVQRQLARKQAEAGRKLKKIKTINESLERGFPPEGLKKP